MKFSRCYSMVVKNQHTCDEFKKRLTRAFNAYVSKRKGRLVHSDLMKNQMLIDKINADFLTPTKAHLEIELSYAS